MTNPLLLQLLIAGLGAMTAGPVAAQTFTTLYTFTSGSGSPPKNNDGVNPSAGCILADGTLYGVAYLGGSSGFGTVFRINTDGTGFTNLHSFTGVRGGDTPSASLVLSNNTLYGTASGVGLSNSGTNGTVFKVNVDGTGFATLHNFTGSAFDGNWPNGALTLWGDTLYGTTVLGGLSGYGTLFKINIDGTGYTNVHSFTGRDGASPNDGLSLVGNTLYGTTSAGISGGGALFKVKTDGTGFTNLHSFASFGAGAAPNGGLIVSGSTLYGTANQGGALGHGTVFRVNTDRTGFTNLYNFSGGIDASYPLAGLLLVGNTLYGTANQGGSSGSGTLFAINTDGTHFTILHAFTATSGSFANHDGAYPNGNLVFSGNILFGSTQTGGSSGQGTVFSLLLPAPATPLSVVASGGNVIVTWPTNLPVIALQSATDLGASAIWATNITAPIVVNGRYTVTNPITGARRFFRLGP